jgi:hypothetical protein
MLRLKTLTACWEHYGVTPTNIVWSWTAVDDARARVAMTFWKTEFEPGSLDVYLNRPWQLRQEETKPRSPGYYERLDTSP